MAEDFVVLSLENVALSDEQFVELCADNRDFLFERTTRKELVIMTPPGSTKPPAGGTYLLQSRKLVTEDGDGYHFFSRYAFSAKKRRHPRSGCLMGPVGTLAESDA
jgi:hypothetical protein